MILRPVSPASPCGPPITNRPVGLMWYFTFFGRSSFGIVASMMSATIALWIFALLTSSACWVLMTTVSTATGSLSSYTTVTCDLPSGRSHLSERSLRRSARARVRRCASMIGIGISSSVSSVA